MLTEGQVTRWVEGYVRAWQTAKTADIEALFSVDAESHEWPYKTDWIGRDEIVQGWKDREAWQKGGWSFDWEILMINGDTAAVKGTGVYTELGRFSNLMVITLDDSDRATMLRLWNNEI